MRFLNIKSGFIFAGNPVVAHEDYPEHTAEPKGGSFLISMGGERIYEGRYYPPADLDLGEILEATVPEIPVVTGTTEKPVAIAEDYASLERRKMEAEFTFGGFESHYEAYVLPGGVSAQNFAAYARAGVDAIEARFLAWTGNFFLTTRGDDRMIAIRETELLPLYFLTDDQLDRIEIEDVTTGARISPEHGQGICALDLGAVRDRMVMEHDILSNVFDIYRNGRYSCRIVIEAGERSRYRHRLKFRNALGVYDMVELTGELRLIPEWKDEEERRYETLDRMTWRLREGRDRVSRRMSAKVNTGSKRPDELRLLMDMLGSGEVWLLDYGPEPVRVIPKVDGPEYGARQEIPESLDLILDFTDPEGNLTGEIEDGSPGRRRVFAGTFDKNFN